MRTPILACRGPALLVIVVVTLTAASAADAMTRTFIFPHVLETSGSVLADPNSFDTEVFVQYTLDPSTPATADVDLYLFGDSGDPVLSDTSQAVAFPAPFSLDNTDPPNRSKNISIDDLINDAGGHPSFVTLGYVIAVVTGDSTDAVDAQSFIVNSRSGPGDLSVFTFQPQEINTNSGGGSLTQGLSAGLSSGPRAAGNAADGMTLRFDGIFENPGRFETNPGGIDTILRAVYAGGLPGAGPASSVTLELSIFNDDGTLMQGLGGPIANGLMLQLDDTFRTIFSPVQDLIEFAGGFDVPEKSGFATVHITGDIDNLALTAVRYDSIVPLEQMDLTELPRTNITGGGSLVPEPATLSLLAVVPMFLARRRRAA